MVTVHNMCPKYKYIITQLFIRLREQTALSRVKYIHTIDKDVFVQIPTTT